MYGKENEARYDMEDESLIKQAPKSRKTEKKEEKRKKKKKKKKTVHKDEL